MPGLYHSVMEAQVFSDSTTDAEGGIVAGQGATLQIPCRYRPNTAAKVIKNVDGEDVVYRGTCYVDKGDLPVKAGTIIQVPGFVDQPTQVLQVYKALFRTRIIL